MVSLRKTRGRGPGRPGCRGTLKASKALNAAFVQIDVIEEGLDVGPMRPPPFGKSALKHGCAVIVPAALAHVLVPNLDLFAARLFFGGSLAPGENFKVRAAL